MTAYQVGNLNLFIFVTESGFELKSARLNTEKGKTDYLPEGYFATLGGLFTCLEQRILKIKSNVRESQKIANLEEFQADCESTLQFVKKLKTQFSDTLRQAFENIRKK